MSYYNVYRTRAALMGILIGYQPIVCQAHSSEKIDENIELGDVETADIIVTAQKRAERLKDVPISIGVVSGAVLDRATVGGTAEALNRVAGVSTTTGLLSGATQIAIRGVTAGYSNLSGSSPVAYYLDSVPFGFTRSATTPDASPYDLDRIEILRGPQGTLYGASAENGVVRILTHEADLHKFEGKMRVSGSRTDDGGFNYRGDVAVNIPIISDRLAVRGVAGYQKNGGWIDKPNDRNANSSDVQNYRVRVKAQPVDALTVDLIAANYHSHSDAPSSSLPDLTTPSTASEPIIQDYDILGANLKYDFGTIVLTSATSYLRYSNHAFVDYTAVGLPAGTLVDRISASKVFTQETSLNSSGSGPWRWSVGAFYRHDKDGLDSGYKDYPPALASVFGGRLNYHDISKSFAIYGELTRKFFDGKIELTAGFRHFEDKVVTTEKANQTGDPLQSPVRTKSTADTPRFILSWHPTRDFNVYASYSEGFRSGINQDPSITRAAPQFSPLKPDLLRNYELGVKGDAAGGKLLFDTAIYYIDWKHVQQALLTDVGTPGAPLFLSALVNGQSASGIGAEASVTARPARGLHLQMNIGWNDLALDGNVFAGPFLLFRKGDRLNFSPKYTIGGSIDYSFDMQQYKGAFSFSGNYTSKRSLHTIARGPVVSTGDNMFIARTSFTVEAPQGWSAALFVDNVGNVNRSVSGPNFGVPQWDSRTPPRTIGLQFEQKF